MLITAAATDQDLWTMEAAKAVRTAGDLAWTGLDRLAPPTGRSWNNDSDSWESRSLSMSDDGSRAVVALASEAGPQEMRTGLFGLNPDAAPGAQWTDVLWLANDWINDPHCTVDMSADGSKVIAAAPGFIGDRVSQDWSTWVTSRFFDGAAFSQGNEIEISASGTPSWEAYFASVAMTASGAKGLLAFTTSQTLGRAVPLTVDPVTAVASLGTSTVDTVSVTVTVVVPAISPASQAMTGVVGQPVTASAVYVTQGLVGPVTYAVSPGLPAGLCIDPANGVISGTPTTVQAATLCTVTATDADGRTATATVTATPTSPTATPTSSASSSPAGSASPTASTSPTGFSSPTPTPTREPQWPRGATGLPDVVAAAGVTRLVRLPVLTSAGQVARVRATCTPRRSGLAPARDTGPYGRILRTERAVRVWVSGERSVVVRVVLTAPAIERYLPYRKVAVYRVLARR